jgi:hypothetical protein
LLVLPGIVAAVLLVHHRRSDPTEEV